MILKKYSLKICIQIEQLVLSSNLLIEKPNIVKDYFTCYIELYINS